jgi:hypothetical protein
LRAVAPDGEFGKYCSGAWAVEVGNMTRWSVTPLVIAVCSAVLHADVTIVQKATVEEGVKAAKGDPVSSPTVTIRIKGMIGRTDVDRVSTIVDAATREVIVLDHARKTARISTPGAPPSSGATSKRDGGRTIIMKDGGVKATGKTQTIDGLTCDEYAFTASVSALEVGPVGEMPAVTAARERRDERLVGPDLASAGSVEEVLRGAPSLVVKGSVWASKDAPGFAEYHEYQNALARANLLPIAMGASGSSLGYSEKLTKALQGVQGLPVLTRIVLSFEGTDQIGMARRIGDTTITTKALSVKTDAIGGDAFKVPEGYHIIKQ